MTRNFKHLLDKKSHNLMKLMKQYSERSELVDFLDDADFNYQITIPCHHMNYTSDTYEKKIKDFVSLLEKLIFTRKELKRLDPKSKKRIYQIQRYATYENKSHVHILIDRPDCKKIRELDNDEVDDFIKTKVIRVLQKLRMFNLKQIDPTLSKFFKTIKSKTDQFLCLNYNTKEYSNNIRRYKNNDKLFSTIDFSNLYIRPAL